MVVSQNYWGNNQIFVAHRALGERWNKTVDSHALAVKRPRSCSFAPARPGGGIQHYKTF